MPVWFFLCSLSALTEGVAGDLVFAVTQPWSLLKLRAWSWMSWGFGFVLDVLLVPKWRCVVRAEPSRDNHFLSSSAEGHSFQKKVSESPLSLSFARSLFFFYASQVSPPTRNRWYESSTVASIRRHVLSRTFTLLSVVSLIVALFLVDLSIILDVPTQTEVDMALTCGFLFFLLEFLGFLLTDDSYPFSFLFWMDLFGAILMVFDVSYFFGVNATEPVRIHDTFAVRSTRSAKFGAVAGRVVRVMKVLRFLPIWDHANKRQFGSCKPNMAQAIRTHVQTQVSVRVAFTVTCFLLLGPVCLAMQPEVEMG